MDPMIGSIGGLPVEIGNLFHDVFKYLRIVMGRIESVPRYKGFKSAFFIKKRPTHWTGGIRATIPGLMASRASVEGVQCVRNRSHSAGCDRFTIICAMCPGVNSQGFPGRGASSRTAVRVRDNAQGFRVSCSSSISGDTWGQRFCWVRWAIGVSS